MTDRRHQSEETDTAAESNSEAEGNLIDKADTTDKPDTESKADTTDESETAESAQNQPDGDDTESGSESSVHSTDEFPAVDGFSPDTQRVPLEDSEMNSVDDGEMNPTDDDGHFPASDSSSISGEGNNFSGSSSGEFEEMPGSTFEKMLADEGDDEDDQASPGLFDDLLSGEPIFENKEVLRPAYTPRKLPHREEQINNMATILVSALRGDTPSNILIYGKTGTGKTASAKFVSDELETSSKKYDISCDVEYINCEVTDTQYRVLAQLANKFIEQNGEYIADRLDELESLADRAQTESDALEETRFETVEEVDSLIDRLDSDRNSFEEVPMTGWPTDRVYSSFFDAVDYRERVVVIMLDEIDKLVEKSGDDTLYNLSRMNSELKRSRVSIIGISNDLKFTDFLDPRVKSSLGEEEIVFPPYDANQLRDILDHRARVAFKDSALTDDVIPLCAAFAAQEHGDARRALDLLRTAGELAERDDTDDVEEHHVRQAQEKIEIDRVVEVVRTLPQQSKLVLFAIILLEKNGVHSINTGEVYNIYRRLCEEIDADVLTQRRVTDLISELDMLGIANAAVVSKGRYGRTKEITLSVPVEDTETVLLSDSRLNDVEEAQPFVQARFE